MTGESREAEESLLLDRRPHRTPLYGKVKKERKVKLCSLRQLSAKLESLRTHRVQEKRSSTNMWDTIESDPVKPPQRFHHF
jgi:hypothetical protein